MLKTRLKMLKTPPKRVHAGEILRENPRGSDKIPCKNRRTDRKKRNSGSPSRRKCDRQSDPRLQKNFHITEAEKAGGKCGELFPGTRRAAFLRDKIKGNRQGKMLKTRLKMWKTPPGRARAGEILRENPCGSDKTPRENRRTARKRQKSDETHRAKISSCQTEKNHI